jgi:hypothetical protein
VQTFKNEIIAKVTRLSVDDDDDDDDDSDFHRPPVQQQTSRSVTPNPAPPKPVAAPAPPKQQAAPQVDLFDTGSATAAASSHGGSPTGDLLGGHSSAPSSSGGLLDMNYGASTTSQPAAHSDFLGMSAPAPSHTPVTSAPSSGNYNGMGSMQQQQQRPPQQQQQQRSMQGSVNMNNFGSHSGGPFGGLGTPWKN